MYVIIRLGDYMKNKVGLVISIVFVMLITGCVNYDASMQIKKDKSMTYSVTFMMNPEVYSKTNVQNELELVKQRGFTVSESSKGAFRGYRIEKSFDNIDKISKTDDVIYTLSELPQTDYMFKVKKGFLKNKYTAKFVFNKTQFGVEGETKKDLDLEDYIEFNDNGMLANENVFNVNKPVLRFNVVLPTSALSNNATKALDSNRNLVWNITNDVQEINFEFELYNSFNIKLLIAAFIVLIIVTISFMIKKRLTPTKGVTPVSIDVDTVQNNTTELVQNVAGNLENNNSNMQDKN